MTTNNKINKTKRNKKRKSYDHATDGFGPSFFIFIAWLSIMVGISQDSDFLVFGGMLIGLIAGIMLIVGKISGKYTIHNSHVPANNSTSSIFSSSDNQSGVRCSKCGSTQISAQKRGFKVGRAVGVGIVTGIFGGLLTGAAGKNKIVITCLSCGHEWRP